MGQEISEISQGTNDWELTSIHDIVSYHLSSACSSLLLVYPIRLEPVVVGDLAKDNLAADDIANAPVGKASEYQAWCRSHRVSSWHSISAPAHTTGT